MLRRYFCLFLFCVCFYSAKADHISGSELIYEYLGPGSLPNTQKIRFTYRLFRGCNSTSPSLSGETVTLAIYPTSTGILYQTLNLSYQTTLNISLNTSLINCFTGNISACYGIGIFTGTIDLPITADGFTASWIRCCRPFDITNLPPGEIGIYPIAKIPGTNIIGNGHNTSAVFPINDTALVCAGKEFRMNFGATDADGDSLVYRLTAGNNWIPQFEYNPPPLSQLNYTTINYKSGFSATDPTGTSPTLNASTGEIRGMAPASPGRYLFCILVEEWRNGTKISDHVKEIPVTVGSCDFVEAVLPEKIIQCNSDQVSFENGSASSGITSYLWIFDTAHRAGNISALPTPVHQYSDTGTYIAKLVVSNNTGCKDSATTQVLIYPGLKAGFSVNGDCIRYPFLFTDTSSSKGGNIVKWTWHFGDAVQQNNSSILQNPSFLYLSAGSKNIKLAVESEKGCRDSITRAINVIDKPDLLLSFRDTSICRTDTVQLKETSAHPVYQWTPARSIIDEGTSSPKVYPAFTTTYYVTATKNNCDNIDSIKVTVLAKDNVFAGKDTVICKGDPVYLHANTDAPVTQWSGDATLKNAGSISTTAFPQHNMQYIINANPGRCEIRDTMNVAVIPYPFVLLPADAVICAGEKILVQAVIIGSSFSWSQANSLSDATILSPYAAPSKNTQYVLTAWDTLGCPKPSADTIEIKVIPRFNVYAGRDTSVVAGQPLQLLSFSSDTSVSQFMWSPTTGLNNAFISNPLVTLTAGVDSVRYKVTAYSGRCIAEDEIVVKLFAGEADLYIPSAFTPNGDGINDAFRIRSAGVASIEFLQIFNRNGQLIFKTANAGVGWDGATKGGLQSSGTYIYWIRAVSFDGKIIERKGTVVLIR